MNSQNKQFGLEKLNQVLTRCDLGASAMRDAILESLDRFTDSTAALDDRTLLMAKIL
jgi:serine phosphatase RsbU (regulator of sigma subunit)